jgi:transcriptional regulator with GAF, ATPase, and Fis domain
VRLTFYFSELPRQFQDALYDETKKCALLKNAHELPGALVEFGRLKGPRDSLLIPLRRYQKLQGFILITTASQDFFERGNVRFFQRMGQTVSRAVTATLLFTKAEKHEEFTSVIDELKRKKIERQPFERTLDFCLGSLIRLLGAERCSVMVYDPAQKTLKVCAAKGYRVYPIAGSTFKWGEGVAGLALKESKIVSLPRLKDSDKHPWFGRLFAEPGNTEFKLKSLLCVPLFEEAEPLGVINISTINFHKDFEKSDIEMVQQIANRMSNLLRDLR